MISEKNIEIVKSTVPVLEKNGVLLTQHFYNRMFGQSPEVRKLFNPSNQNAGTQQKALAGAICAYAANIDNLEVLGGAVELIANKHASLRILPEHYPIVGHHLLESIKEVLGNEASEDVILAWAEAYEFLSKILIGREEQIYSDQRKEVGGWNGFRKFKVDQKYAESENITSFYLTPCDEEPVPNFKPGQYITVRLPSQDGSTTMRNYSLSDKPGLKHFRISVKRELAQSDSDPDGYVSNYLSNSVGIGDVLDVAPPCGEFYLDVSERHNRPLVLLAAGVGVTPIMSMLQAALESMPKREVYFIHGCINEKVQAFKKTVDLLAESYSNLTIHYRYSEDESSLGNANCSKGFIDAELIESIVKQRDADYYFCGPKPFMINIYHDLLEWGIPASQVHFEFFGPREELLK